MPEARASDFQRVARNLGFTLARQKGSHQRWKHADGRATTIPVHPNTTISGPLYHALLEQLGISEEQFKQLK